jgi:hypothetical protein
VIAKVDMAEAGTDELTLSISVLSDDRSQVLDVFSISVPYDASNAFVREAVLRTTKDRGRVRGQLLSLSEWCSGKEFQV